MCGNSIVCCVLFKGIYHGDQIKGFKQLTRQVAVMQGEEFMHNVSSKTWNQRDCLLFIDKYGDVMTSEY
jgi:hypothetical protein